MPETLATLTRRLPRLMIWKVVCAALLLALVLLQPQQALVLVYKLALICTAAVVGYWLDRSLFPYARPDGYLQDVWQKGTREPIGAADFEVVPAYLWVFALAMLRRALIMLAVVLGVAMGL